MDGNENTKNSATQTTEVAGNTSAEYTEVVKKKKKWLIPVIIGAIVALIVAIFAAVIIVAVVSVTAPKMRLKKQLDVGEKYLTDMDYDNAILAYRTAIEMNPKAEEGYLGLAGVYDTMAGNSESQDDPEQALEYLEKAVDVLREGEDKTGSGNIRQERERLENRKEELEVSVREQVFYKECYDYLIAYKQELNFSYTQFGIDREPAKNISFCDLDGDKIPEMVYAKQSVFYGNGYNYEYYTLHFAALRDGKLTDIIEPMGFGEPAAGSSHYYLFKKDTEAGLYGICEYGDEWWTKEFLEFDPSADGSSLERKIIYKWESEPNYEGDYRDIITCWKGESQISEGEYNDATQGLIQSSNLIVFRSDMYTSDYYTNDEIFAGKTDISMTCEEAIAFLNDWLAANYKLKPSDEGDYAIFSQIPDEFYFSSGAGGWGTSLVINPDGTFEADYHDSNMGESGPGYDATVYVSSCKGRFSKAVKINEYTYRVTLEELKYDDEEFGKETFETLDGYTTRFVTSELYGLEGGKTFYIYLKGAPVDELPAAFVDWVKMPMALKDEKELPFTGIYNAEMQEGFASWE